LLQYLLLPSILIMRLLLIASALTLAAISAAGSTIIQVGGSETVTGGPAQFIPPSVNASKGSVVTFRFSGVPGNHSITQSTFDSPCQPLSGGFDSGFIYVPSGFSSDFPEWNLTITDDSQPIWFYCQQLSPAPHCSGAGMVGSINAPDSGNDTFAAFQTAAKKSSGAPGQGEGGLAGQGASASAPPGPLTSGVSGYSVPTGTAPPSSASSSGSAATSSSSSNGAGTSLTANGPLVLLTVMLGAGLANFAG